MATSLGTLMIHLEGNSNSYLAWAAGVKSSTKEVAKDLTASFKETSAAADEATAKIKSQVDKAIADLRRRESAWTKISEDEAEKRAANVRRNQQMATRLSAEQLTELKNQALVTATTLDSNIRLSNRNMVTSTATSTVAQMGLWDRFRQHVRSKVIYPLKGEWSELMDLMGRGQRGFGTTGILRSGMVGLGIGSSMMAMNSVVEMIAGFWKRAAEAAQTVEERTKGTLDVTKQLTSLKNTDEQNYAKAVAERESAARRLEAVKNSPVSSIFGISGTTEADKQKKINEAQAEYNSLILQTAVYERKVRDEQESKIKDLSERLIEADKQMKDTLGKYQSVGLSRSDLVAGLSNRKNKLDYELSQNRIALGGANIDPKVKIKLLEDQLKLVNELTVVQARLNDYEQKSLQLGREMGAAIAYSFEDAIVSGQKLSDIFDQLIRDLLRMAINQAVTQPLMGYLGGALGGIFSGKASGGPASMGEALMVGERGPEMFIPSTNGSVVRTEDLRKTGGGTVYQIDARGTDESVVKRLEMALFALAGPGVVERRALSAHSMTLRRGGSGAAAIGG